MYIVIYLIYYKQPIFKIDTISIKYYNLYIRMYNNFNIICRLKMIDELIQKVTLVCGR